VGVGAFRGTTFDGVKEYRKCQVLKVPRECLLVLLVKVDWKEGKVLGSGRGKAVGSELCYEKFI
jgi:hypothetical protein